jgi:hypothetical protein
VLYLSDIHIFNNVFWRAGRCTGWGVRVNNVTATGVVVESNTFYDNGAGDRACDQSTGSVEAQVLVEAATSVVLRNNIFAPAGSESDVSVTAPDGTVSGSNNLFGLAAPGWDSAPVTGAPGFFDPVVGDFHLGPDSAAIDAAVASGVTADHDGTARPQGAASDVGAYERIP